MKKNKKKIWGFKYNPNGGIHQWVTVEGDNFFDYDVVIEKGSFRAIINNRSISVINFGRYIFLGVLNGPFYEGILLSKSNRLVANVNRRHKINSFNQLVSFFKEDTKDVGLNLIGLPIIPIIEEI